MEYGNLTLDIKNAKVKCNDSEIQISGKELDLLEVLELTNIDNVLRTKDLIGMWSTITINDNYPFLIF